MTYKWGLVHGKFFMGGDSELVWLQNDDIRYGIIVSVVDRSPGVFIAVIGQFQFGGRRDVQHDHSRGVHRQLDVGIAFQCICLSTEDISDLEKSKSDCVDKSKHGIFLKYEKKTLLQVWRAVVKEQ